MRPFLSIGCAALLALAGCAGGAESDPVIAVAESGFAALEAGEPERAVAAFSELIAAAPDDVDLLTARGVALLEAGRYDDAVRDLSQALELDPFAGDAYRNRALAREALREYDAARVDYTNAIRIDPTDPELYLARAVVAIELDAESAAEIDVALAQLTEAIASEGVDAPGAGARLAERASLYVAQGEVVLATADLATLVEREPDDAHTQLSLATARSILGETEAAFAGFQRVIELDPAGAVPAHRGLAQLYEQIGSYADARDEYRRALALDPADPITLSSLAWLLATTPDAEVRASTEALKLATRACSAEASPSWECLDVLAAAHRASGNVKAAIAQQERAIALAPEALRPALEERLAVYRGNRG